MPSLPVEDNKIRELPGKGGLESLQKTRPLSTDAFRLPKTHECGLETLRVMLLPNMLLLNVGGVGIEP